MLTSSMGAARAPAEAEAGPDGPAGSIWSATVRVPRYAGIHGFLAESRRKQTG